MIEVTSENGVVLKDVVIIGEIKIMARYSSQGFGYVVDTNFCKIIPWKEYFRPGEIPE
jgi:hypothetical protein